MPYTAVAGPFAEVDAAVKWLRKWDCGNRMHQPMWKTVPGSRQNYKRYKCNAHVNCSFPAVVMKKDQQWFVQTDTSVKHSSENNLKRRLNSPLNADVEARARDAFKYHGDTPAKVLSIEQARAVENGAELLEEEGVAGVSQPLVSWLQPSRTT